MFQILFNHLKALMYIVIGKICKRIVDLSAWMLTRNRKSLTTSMDQSGHQPKVGPQFDHQQQNFDYFLILDFEATCDHPRQPMPMEIIEFPVLKMDCKTLEIVDKFHRYVRPTVHPKLSPFCTQLTGILQEMVDESETFTHVFRDFQQWLLDTRLINENRVPKSRFTFITCGDWDLTLMLPNQCRRCNFDVPSYMRSWINVKKSFADHHNRWPRSQAYLLDFYGIEPIGRAHSGIDDCHNLAEIVRHLCRSGYVFKNNAKYKIR